MVLYRGETNGLVHETGGVLKEYLEKLIKGLLAPIYSSLYISPLS